MGDRGRGGEKRNHAVMLFVADGKLLFGLGFRDFWNIGYLGA